MWYTQSAMLLIRQLYVRALTRQVHKGLQALATTTCRRAMPIFNQSTWHCSHRTVSAAARHVNPQRPLHQQTSPLQFQTGQKLHVQPKAQSPPQHVPAALQVNLQSPLHQQTLPLQLQTSQNQPPPHQPKAPVKPPHKPPPPQIQPPQMPPPLKFRRGASFA